MRKPQSLVEVCSTPHFAFYGSHVSLAGLTNRVVPPDCVFCCPVLSVCLTHRSDIVCGTEEMFSASLDSAVNCIDGVVNNR